MLTYSGAIFDLQLLPLQEKIGNCNATFWHLGMYYTLDEYNETVFVTS